MRTRSPLTSKHIRHHVKRTDRANDAKQRARNHGSHGLFRGQNVQDPQPCRPPGLWLNDLECVRTLGTGAYGCVLLVRVRPRQESHQIDRPGSLFAVKVLQKVDMHNFDKRCPEDTDAERESLCKLPWSAWVNGIVDTFHDAVNLYLMLECIPAGVLHDLIHWGLDATMARFYYANIACALDFLHTNGVVHRDLKPANILVKPDGYLSLVDFGLAKPESTSYAWAMVGTPVYMAPELLIGQAGIGCGVDWFASGVILYEMMTKRVPYYGKSEEHIYLRVINKKYKWPRNVRVGKSLKSLVAGLLEHEAVNRLGVGKPVTEHAWLRGIDWKKMDGQRYVAPWIPGDARLGETWQERCLPPQVIIPDLEVVKPPEHLMYDCRSVRKRKAEYQTEDQMDEEECQ